MIDTAAKEASSCSDTLPKRPNTPSSVYSSTYGNEEFGIDDWPANVEAALKDARYDDRGFLVGFENTAAYTCPRPAPSPPQSIHPVLTAACSPPSPPPNGPLPLLPICEMPNAMSYEAIAPWTSGPPSSLPASSVELSQTYRNGYLSQCIEGKQPVKKRGRYNLQGYWLARGTLKGLVQHQPDSSSEETVQEKEPTKSTDDTGSSRLLFSRVKNSVRRSGTSARLSMLKGIEEFARAGERVGYIPST
ncbi:hypothetical protein H2200_011746 [Cladophialophora chaetospira]|uniref:Uncharacterized protein n=1 Tax=Cladophialophora chaetospira TaxID=386627 RepID=A0AA39CCT4_9EURO|nr:hypothetical protein H2200_011746 [Cladophialophora chaetospira]